MHEYVVNEHPKEKIIFYLAVITITFVPAIIENLLTLFNITFGTTISFGITSSVLFGIIYIIFSKYLWKCYIFCKMFNYPNLNGTYDVYGVSIINPTGEEKRFEAMKSRD